LKLQKSNENLKLKNNKLENQIKSLNDQQILLQKEKEDISIDKKILQ
jgi:cell division protein FtsB